MAFRIGADGECIAIPWEREEAALVAAGYVPIRPARLLGIGDEDEEWDDLWWDEGGEG